MLPPKVPDGRVDQVVCDGHRSRRVTEEGSSPGDGVQHAVQAQLGCLSGAATESFLETPRSSERETGEVGHTGAVAEIVCESTARQDGLRAGEVGEDAIFEGEVFELVLVQAGQRMQFRGVGEGAGTEEGLHALALAGIESRGRGLLRLRLRTKGCGRLGGRSLLVLRLVAACEGIPDGGHGGLKSCAVGWSKGAAWAEGGVVKKIWMMRATQARLGKLEVPLCASKAAPVRRSRDPSQSATGHPHP